MPGLIIPSMPRPMSPKFFPVGIGYSPPTQPRSPSNSLMPQRQTTSSDSTESCSAHDHFFKSQICLCLCLRLCPSPLPHETDLTQLTPLTPFANSSHPPNSHFEISNLKSQIPNRLLTLGYSGHLQLPTS